MTIFESLTSESEHRQKEDPAAALLLAAQAGSNSSLGLLLQGYRDYLNLLADEELGPAIKVKASASDLVQDSFLEAKRDFGQFTGQSTEEFQAWLRRLLLNNVANVIRNFQGTEKRDISRETPGTLFRSQGDAGWRKQNRQQYRNEGRTARRVAVGDSETARTLSGRHSMAQLRSSFLRRYRCSPGTVSRGGSQALGAGHRAAAAGTGCVE